MWEVPEIDARCLAVGISQPGMIAHAEGTHTFMANSRPGAGHNENLSFLKIPWNQQQNAVDHRLDMGFICLFDCLLRLRRCDNYSCKPKYSLNRQYSWQSHSEWSKPENKPVFFWGEREGGGEGRREGDRQTDRQTESERESERQTDRERVRERVRGRQTDRQRQSKRE